MGDFDIDLPLLGNSGIECRSGGANGDYTIIFNFTNTLTNVAGAAVTSGTGSVVGGIGTIGTDPHQYIVNLTGVTNAQHISVSLNGAHDSEDNIGDISSTMGVLIGDTNANGAVNSADVAQTKSRIGQPLDASNFRSDANVNGSINASDTAMVKSNIGSALP
jgi:hypothetical protein